VGLRGRHMRDIGNMAEAQNDFLLARYLYPTSRHLYFLGTWASILQSVNLFEDGEEGTPQNLAETIKATFGRRQFGLGGLTSNPIDIGCQPG
jgi:hypothetical protein